MNTLNTLIKTMTQARASERNMETAQRECQQEKADLASMTVSFAKDAVGKNVVFKKVSSPNFWPSKKGQQWFEGRLWPHEKIHDHTEYEEVAIQGETDVEGKVVDWRQYRYVPDLFEVVVLAGPYYYSVTLTEATIKKMTIL